MSRRALLISCIFAFVLTLPVIAQDPLSPVPPSPDAMGPPSINDMFDQAIEPQRLSTTMTVFLLLTVLSIAPAIIIMTTSFVRIIVVLGFLRQAMATQQTPPNQVLIGLAMFMSLSLIHI